MKFWLSVIILMAACKLEAAGLYDISWENKVWRSSVPSVATTEMVIATGAVAVYGIHVQSSSVANQSHVSVINSSTTDDALDLSTFTYATGWGFSNSSLPSFFIPIKKVFNRGFKCTTVGESRIELLWDWVTKPPTSDLDSAGRY